MLRVGVVCSQVVMICMHLLCSNMCLCIIGCAPFNIAVNHLYDIKSNLGYSVTVRSRFGLKIKAP